MANFTSAFAKDYLVKIKSLMPKELQTLELKKDTAETIEKKLGKADLIEGEKRYYAIGGFKYSLELIFEKNILKQFSYTFISPRPDIKETGIDQKEFNLLTSGIYAKKAFFKAEKPEVDVIADQTNNTLYSVRFK